MIHEEMELAGAVAAAVTGARHVIHALGVMLPRWVWDGMAPIVAELARPAAAPRCSTPRTCGSVRRR